MRLELAGECRRRRVYASIIVAPLVQTNAMRISPLAREVKVSHPIPVVLALGLYELQDCSEVSGEVCCCRKLPGWVKESFVQTRGFGEAVCQLVCFYRAMATAEGLEQ